MNGYKAKTGGFLDPLPHRTFAKDGLVSLDGLKPYGSRQAPWEIRLDYKWLGVYLQLAYYDHVVERSREVPPGLVLDAFDEKRGVLIGAGVHIDDTTAYILHAGTSEQLREKVQYRFDVTDVPYIELSADPSLESWIAGEAPPDDFDGVRERYVLPKIWTTPGWEVDQDGRVPWEDFRAEEWKTSLGNPIVFHLDDFVLASNGVPVTFDAGEKVFSLMDHALAIREPDDTSPQLWKNTAKVKRNYFRAEDAYYVGGKGFDATTLLVYRNGEFYELRDERVGPGKADAGLGMRAAKRVDLAEFINQGDAQNPAAAANDHYSLYSLLLLNDACEVQYEDGKVCKLCHLLVYVPYRLPSNSDVLDKHFAAAAKRWTQRHPGEPDSDGLKDYFICGESVSAGDRVVKPRYFFARGDTTCVHVDLYSPGSPSDVGPSGHGLTLRYGDQALDEKSVLGSDRNYPAKDPADEIDYLYFTLAHEMGHVLGLDHEEYPARLQDGFSSSSAWKQDLISSFGILGDTTSRPYAIDWCAVMNGDYSPRLRYLWDLVSHVNQKATLTKLEIQGKVSACYPPKKLRYDPEKLLGSASSSSFKGPWTPLREGPVPSGTAAGRPSRWRLFVLGDDEGKQAMGIADCQALVLIETFFWFEFEKSGGKDLDATKQWKVLAAFNNAYYQKGKQRSWSEDSLYYRMPKLVFELRSRAPSASLERIAVFFAPRFASHDFLSPSDLPLPLQKLTNLKVTVVSNGGALPAGKSDLLALKTASDVQWALKGAPPGIRTGESEVGLSLQRFALGAVPVTGGKLDNTIKPDDLEPLAEAVARSLGEAAGSRLVMVRT